MLWQITAENAACAASRIDGGEESMAVHVMVCEGEIEAQAKGIMHRLRRNGFGLFFIEKSSFEVLHAAPGTRAFVMIYTDTYIFNLQNNRQPLPFTSQIGIRKEPVKTLTPNILRLFLHRIDIIREACRAEEHLFRDEMIRLANRMFLLDFAHTCIKRQNEMKPDARPGRRHELFYEFTKLLPLHAAREHTVGFYASRLCVTPQYLNRIVKEMSGKTVYELICFNIVGEINKRLENTNDTMKKIAADFNFSDQTALTKFYKRATGRSMKEFKLIHNS